MYILVAKMNFRKCVPMQNLDKKPPLASRRQTMKTFPVPDLIYVLILCT